MYHSMAVRDSLVLPVTEFSQVAEVRRVATALAGRLGFSETGAGKVALVVTEVSTNLVKHATGGEVILGTLEIDQVSGIEVLALDRGPGMGDLARCSRDGYSTTGSPGTGLGATKRLAASVEIDSRSGVGTVLMARLWSKPLPEALSQPSLEIGAVSLPKPGEDVCGDQWATAHSPDRALILVADGLGHGPDAAEASLEAVRIFHERAALAPAAIIEAIHIGLRSTRGAAVAVAEVDLPRRVVRFAGLGNITSVVFTPVGNRRMVSHNGTAGYAARKIQEFTYPWPEEALLVLYSDGLSTSWDLGSYPGLIARQPDLVAATLYRDYARGRDDVTVVVAREAPAGGLRIGEVTI